MSGRLEVTTRIGFLFHAPAAHFITYLSPTSIFALQASMEVPLAVFTFLGSFYRFYAHLTAPIEILRFEFVFYLGQLILWVL